MVAGCLAALGSANHDQALASLRASAARAIGSVRPAQKSAGQRRAENRPKGRTTEWPTEQIRSTGERTALLPILEREDDRIIRRSRRTRSSDRRPDRDQVLLCPTIIAVPRKVPNVGSVVVINLFLGSTFIGWVVAMAARSRPR
jgi:hypothetical protein